MIRIYSVFQLPGKFLTSKIRFKPGMSDIQSSECYSNNTLGPLKRFLSLGYEQKLLRLPDITFTYLWLHIHQILGKEVLNVQSEQKWLRTVLNDGVSTAEITAERDNWYCYQYYCNNNDKQFDSVQNLFMSWHNSLSAN